MDNAKIIFMDMGHLQLFRKTTLECPMGDGKIYYFDKRFPVEVGPFTSNSEAISHWKNILEHTNVNVTYEKGDMTFVTETEPQPDNVIYVDFVLKRRIR